MKITREIPGPVHAELIESGDIQTAVDYMVGGVHFDMFVFIFDMSGIVFRCGMSTEIGGHRSNAECQEILG